MWRHGQPGEGRHDAVRDQEESRGEDAAQPREEAEEQRRADAEQEPRRPRVQRFEERCGLRLRHYVQLALIVGQYFGQCLFHRGRLLFEVGLQRGTEHGHVGLRLGEAGFLHVPSESRQLLCKRLTEAAHRVSVLFDALQIRLGQLDGAARVRLGNGLTLRG